MSDQPMRDLDSTIPLERKVAFLKRADIYPQRTKRVETVETHMSWVFLTDYHAYKLKKPVRYEFLDFSTLARRKFYCEEEVRLNRPLAKDVYLDTVPLVWRNDTGFRLGGDGEPVEWLVKSRRLPEEWMLDHAIRGHRATAVELRKVAHALAAFYKEATPVDMSPAQYRERLERDIQANGRELTKPEFDLPLGLVDPVEAAQLDFLRRNAALFDARVQRGKVIEGHGDLRPEHVCLEPDPLVIDRLEFNPGFRILDPADELAYLAMECEMLEASFVGPVLFETYRNITQDHPAEPLVQFYTSYRAMLRAKIAIWHTREPRADGLAKWRRFAERYLDLAEAAAQRLR